MKHFYLLFAMLLTFVEFNIQAQTDFINKKIDFDEKINFKNSILEKYNPEYLNISMQLDEKHNTKQKTISEDWWEPDTIWLHVHRPETYDEAQDREIYLYNENGYLYIYKDEEIYNEEWVTLDQITYSYDENNNLVTELFQHFNFNNSLISYTYTSSKISSILKQFWYGEWVNFEYITYEYDDKYNLLSETYKDWDDEDWLNTFRLVYTYDNNNNLLSAMYQFWDEDWVNSELFTATYKNNRLEHYVYQYWEDEQWINNGKISFSYDINTLTVVSQFWEDNVWINDILTTKVYDDNHNILNELFQFWEDEWINDIQFIYTYVEGKLISELKQDWYGQWNDNYKYTYEYSDNNIVSIKTERVEYFVLENYSLVNISYDDNNNGIFGDHWRWDRLHGEEFFYMWGGNVTVYYNNGKSKIDRPGCLKIEVSYTHAAAPGGIDENISETKNISVYPNPTTGEINISSKESEIKSVTVFNQLGKQVMQINGTNRINISDLTAGIYILQITTNNCTVMEKIVKL
ncbi:T9SS type A sorting domain-containing protein [Bacteroidales bacterium OttesenSCG-928-L14]|nr:T9SS type A sorting domain-containing protein [Bacteroidales bacterium OttesenSCG-928-L14]